MKPTIGDDARKEQHDRAVEYSHHITNVLAQLGAEANLKPEIRDGEVYLVGEIKIVHPAESITITYHDLGPRNF